ncbi:RidA family protein [Desulfurispirillum indicum]|uniref:Endoribonuclease L-PSP n=1 Tax=Desulfurispirillum indicum (strain ATCC BAA-1389 / DSM 22839 / S5) TaxID=653733 RepID=E6W485_DESIS|nr:RidA family protein [Desulfurispirillum indicum]ADU64763.1 endoribonuclease L-PSP [Desulfurispirillum indicum S5]UCZ56697.1 RidA family protein [Desulfurispirillum indicum]
MKTIIKTSNAPAAIGPYEQAIAYNGTLYCSGQIPLTPAGDMVEGDVADQTRQCLENLAAICKAAGTGFQNALKITIFLTDMADFQNCNAVYAEYFEKAKPARACVAVKALPKGAKVEIEGIFALEQ